MAEINIHLDLTVSRGLAKTGLVAFFLLAGVPELGSESVTLSTYYPAPSGVYTQMITTDNTWLARNGGAVVVGNGASAGKLTIYDGNLAMRGGHDINMSGGSELQMGGAAINGTFGLLPNYANWSAYGTGAGGAAIYNSNEASYRALMLVGNNSGGGGIRRVKVWDELTVNGNSIVTGSENVSGNESVTGYQYVGGIAILANTAGCRSINISRGVNNCLGGEYITLISGVYSRYYAFPNRDQSSGSGFGGAVPTDTGSALCCSYASVGAQY